MILGLVEHDRGVLNPLSFEMLTLAHDLGRKLATDVVLTLIGQQSRVAADQLSNYGSSLLYLIEHALLDEYAGEAWGKSLHQLIEETAPKIVLAAATDQGNEVLAHTAAFSGLPLAANCIEAEPGQSFRVTRYRWGGSLLEEAILLGEPKLLTVEPHALEAQQPGPPAELRIEVFTPQLSAKDIRARVGAREEVPTEGVTLETASVVFGGGRGVGSAEGFKVLEEVAELLSGAVGGSRVATNNGWRPHSDQIGLTGNRIAPDLYVACGISGAIQHLVGCKGSKHILVINKDREAPFFKRADYGVIGDLHEILPTLAAGIRNKKSL